MATSFSQFTPIQVKKISALILGKVKKIEAQTKKWFSYKKNEYLNNLLHKIRKPTFVVNCFALLLVQTMLNDIGKKRGEGERVVHTCAITLIYEGSVR